MYLSEIGQTGFLTTFNINYLQLCFSKEKSEWYKILMPQANSENVRPVSLYVSITLKIVIFTILSIYQINSTLEIWKKVKKHVGPS